MNFWLMKSEPNAFGIDDLAQRPRKIEHWDGVRNYQARNMMRDQMRKGDLAFFYHSNCTPPGIAGMMEIVRESYPDFSSFNPESKYFDPNSTLDKPRWFMVDVKFKQKFKQLLSLDDLRQHPELAQMQLLRKGSRLSIMPVTQAEWEIILQLVSILI